MRTKRILDSVHGYIEVPALFITKIIDTIYFQRLRRIEQTSTRALFPSARHDRFIHSLGVYHIGRKIMDSLEKRGYLKEGQPLHHKEKSINSYCLACLLHDVAHSPFSHTFEEFFELNREGLDKPLIEVVDNKQFEIDYKNYSGRTAQHEKMSAYIAYKVFRTEFNGRYEEEIERLEDHADWELIVRMICGIYYSNANYDIENCLIDLIHGDVIDADGLDYVCRDAWAAGYQTSNVDVERLIDSIEICKDEDDHFRLAFTSKSLNEIEAVLSVKSFQQYHVINHHTITYEQNLLKEAVKAAAERYFPKKGDGPEPIAKLCDLKSFTEVIKSDDEKISIIHPADDDYVYMMKSCIDIPCVNEWFSRNYRLVPVWKSRAEFYSIFKFLRGKQLTSQHWIFSDRCVDFLNQNLGLDKQDIRLLKASPKYKGSFADKVYIKVGERLVKYIDLFPGDKNSFKQPQNDFFYLYVLKGSDLADIREKLKSEAALYVI